jgi:hypothetical protein
MGHWEYLCALQTADGIYSPQSIVVFGGADEIWR